MNKTDMSFLSRKSASMRVGKGAVNCKTCAAEVVVEQHGLREFGRQHDAQPVDVTEAPLEVSERGSNIVDMRVSQ